MPRPLHLLSRRVRRHLLPPLLPPKQFLPLSTWFIASHRLLFPDRRRRLPRQRASYGVVCVL